jgi:hypothetical protein
VRTVRALTAMSGSAIPWRWSSRKPAR